MDYSKLYRIQHESREVVNETIDRILTKGAEKLYIKYVLAKQPEFLGELYSKTSSIVIDNLMLSHDKGDDKKTVKRFWPEDTEPVFLI
jgi:hypothetical protein